MRSGVLLILLCSLWLVGCEAEPPQHPLSDINMSVADAGSGEKLFNQSHEDAPACSSCHVVDTDAKGIGPSLKGIAPIAGNRVSGQDATEYLYWSIVRPARYLVTGYSNVMYSKYDEVFASEDIADLIAYLQTLE